MHAVFILQLGNLKRDSEETAEYTWFKALYKMCFKKYILNLVGTLDFFDVSFVYRKTD